MIGDFLHLSSFFVLIKSVLDKRTVEELSYRT